MPLVISLIVRVYHRGGGGCVGLEKAVGQQPLQYHVSLLSEAEDGMWGTTEDIRAVLVTTLFMLMIPGRAEKAPLCPQEGRNRAGKAEAACPCLM